MKVPTFSNPSLRFKSITYLKKPDFTGKFNVLTGHFFIEKKFDMLYNAVSYTHLRAHETGAYLVCRLLLEKKKKKNFFNDTATTEIYTLHIVGSVRCV